MSSKLIAIAEAVQLVKDGDVVAIGGQSLYRRPVSMVRELIRAGRKRLTMVGLTAGFETDLLLANGCLDTIRAGYVGLDFLGLAPHFGKSNSVRIVEETEASIIQGIRASMGYLGFLPFRGTRQTDLMKVRPDLKSVICPYTGEEYIAWPAIKPDVALIHVAKADAYGNAHIASNPSIDRLLAGAAARTIVTAETIVPTRELEGNQAIILGRSVTAVVHLPLGAHPTSSYPSYRMDVPFLLAYIQACREGTVGSWMSELLSLTPDDYIARHVLPFREQLLVKEALL